MSLEGVVRSEGNQEQRDKHSSVDTENVGLMERTLESCQQYLKRCEEVDTGSWVHKRNYSGI